MIAVQGPNARAKAAHRLPAASARRRSRSSRSSRVRRRRRRHWFVARTGYTGEDGFEIMLPAGEAAGLWRALTRRGVAPCGLGARDTLRLEAGMNLYGKDMDEITSRRSSRASPGPSRWSRRTRDFVGRAALARRRRAGGTRKLVGLLLEDRGVLRSHQKVVVTSVGEGEITSGTFSPTLRALDRLARVPRGDRRRRCRSISAASCCRRASSSRRSCATARSLSRCNRLRISFKSIRLIPASLSEDSS